jgi:hypothetical protein
MRFNFTEIFEVKKIINSNRARARARFEARLVKLAEFEPSSKLARLLTSRVRTTIQNSTRARAEFESPFYIFEPSSTASNSARLGSNTALLGDEGSKAV